MQEQAATLDADQRRAIFNDVQRILAENVPALQFVAPRLYVAHSARLVGVEPSVLRPPILWSADTLSVSRRRPHRHADSARRLEGPNLDACVDSWLAG